MSKIVMVDTISSFRIRYAIRLEDNDPAYYALDTVVCEEHNPDKLKEFSQEHLGYHISNHRVIDEEEYLRIFDEDNDYLKEWSREQKLNLIFDK
jgi:hypothetical protein